MPYDDCIPYFFNSGGLYTIGKVKAYLDGYLKKIANYVNGKQKI